MFAAHWGYDDRHKTTEPRIIEPLLQAFVAANLQGWTLQSKQTNYTKKYAVTVGTIKKYLGSINQYYEVELKLRKIWHEKDGSKTSQLLSRWEKYDKAGEQRQRIPDKVFAELKRLSHLGSRHGYQMAMY